MRTVMVLIGLVFAATLNAGFFDDLLAKLKKDTKKSRVVSVVGVRGSNVSEQETSSLVKASDLYWAE